MNSREFVAIGMAHRAPAASAAERRLHTLPTRGVASLRDQHEALERAAPELVKQTYSNPPAPPMRRTRLPRQVTRSRARATTVGAFPVAHARSGRRPDDGVQEWKRRSPAIEVRLAARIDDDATLW